MTGSLAQPTALRSSSLPRVTRHLPRLSGSVIVWLGLVAFLVAAKLLSLSLVPITFRGSGQAALFSWTTLGAVSVLGLVGVWCAARTGFPDAWAARISNRQRLAVPVLIGFGLGVAAIVLDLLTGGSEAIARVTEQPSFNIDFPGSLLAYSAGGIIVDTEYRLFAVPFLLWLISAVLLRGRGQAWTFWVLATVSSLAEPLLQGVGLTIIGKGEITPLMLGAYMLTAIPHNLASIVIYRRSGLLASVLVRQSYYLIWHILYGALT